MKTRQRRKALEQALAGEQPTVSIAWKCPKCGQVNASWATQCGRCQATPEKAK